MNPDVQQRIRRMFGFILLAFLVLIGWQSYWHLAKSELLLKQTGNRRLARAEQNIPRGSVYDANGVKLAWSDGGTRHYADARTTAPVLGYLDPVYGRTGVEGLWDEELSGLSGAFTQDDLHRIIAGEKPRGKDLILTLDLKLQQAAEKALGDRRGAVVVLDPDSGAIRVLASSPTFDPTRLHEEWDAIQRADDGALRNRALQDHYPPGSTMKLVTASAALMHGIGADTTFTCPGQSHIFGVNVRDYHGEVHGTISMNNALTHSCNNYFARLAVKVGPDNFRQTAESFGFDIPWWGKLEDQRLLPVANPKGEPAAIAASGITAKRTEAIPDGELAHMGFGQSTVVATPLQMAMVSAAIANDGKLMAPYIVSQVRKGGTAKVDRQFKSTAIGFPLDADSAAAVKEMMRRVVTRGTARGADTRGVTVYGKTGTAEQEGGDDHAWFVGFGELSSEQRLAFAVIIERGGTGGRVAVPVARQVLQAWVEEQRER
jgi:peptidoglycan glycosyltransferase